MDCQLLIQNARIIDGSGTPSYWGSLAVDQGKITAVGENLEFSGQEVMDAHGLALCPGFIDVHRHADLLPFHFPGSQQELRQGITTVLSGNCGFSPFPLLPEHEAEEREFLECLLGPLPDPAPWRTLAEYAAWLATKPLPINMGTLVGNGQVRVATVGFQGGSLSTAELKTACDLVGQALDQGAFGISLGLMYVPENNYSRRELSVLCAQAACRRLPVAVHLRGEGAILEDSVKEMLEVAAESGAHLHISHFKSAGRRSWGVGWRRALEHIRRAQEQGLQVTWDAYPYDAGSTSLLTLLPPWAQEGGIDMVIARLQDPDLRKKIADELCREQADWDNLVCSTGWERVVISSSADADCIGRSVAQLGQQWNITPQEAAFRLIVRERGRTGMVFFHMSPQDVREILCLPETLVISDTLYLPGAVPHPRAYGTQARFLGRCARDQGWMPLERAVEKCTSLPAKTFGIAHRGLLKAGYAADLVLFDPQKILDTADYETPTSYPVGIESVFVNGQLAMSNGKVENAGAGRVLLHGGERKNAL